VSTEEGQVERCWYGAHTISFTSEVEKAYTWMRGNGCDGSANGFGFAAAATASVLLVAVVAGAARALGAVGARRARPMKTSRKSVAFWGRFMIASWKGSARLMSERMKSL